MFWIVFSDLKEIVIELLLLKHIEFYYYLFNKFI
jgi:hypothetical protein